MCGCACPVGGAVSAFPSSQTTVNPNHHELRPNHHEMGSRTTVNRRFQHHRVQAPKGVAVSGFTVNQFTVVPRRGADGAAPREPGTTVKAILPSVSPRIVRGLQRSQAPCGKSSRTHTVPRLAIRPAVHLEARYIPMGGDAGCLPPEAAGWPGSCPAPSSGPMTCDRRPRGLAGRICAVFAPPPTLKLP